MSNFKTSYIAKRDCFTIIFPTFSEVGVTGYVPIVHIRPVWNVSCGISFGSYSLWVRQLS